MQIPLDPRAGFVAEVPRTAPYPDFPADPLGRIRWAEEAPILGKRKGEGRGVGTGAKVVLIVLAHRANAEGCAWPSVATLASWCSLSRRGVHGALSALAGRGWVAVETRERRSSRYWPKAPHEERCSGCFGRLPVNAELCARCGCDLWGGALSSRSAHSVHP